MNYILDIPVIVSGDYTGRNQKVKSGWFYDTVSIIIKPGELPELASIFIIKSIKNKNRNVFKFYQNQDGEIYQKATSDIMIFKSNQNDMENCIENLFTLTNSELIEKLFSNSMKPSKKDFIDDEKMKKIVSTNKDFIQNKIQEYFDENYLKHEENNVFYKKNEHSFYIQTPQEVVRSGNSHIRFTKKNISLEKQNNTLGMIPISPVSLETLLKMKAEYNSSQLIEVEKEGNPIVKYDTIVNFDVIISKRTPLPESFIVNQCLENILNFYKPFDIRELTLEGSECFFSLQKSIHSTKKEPVFENLDFVLLNYERLIETFLKNDMIKKSTENLNVIKNIYQNYLLENEKNNLISWSMDKGNETVREYDTIENMHILTI